MPTSTQGKLQRFANACIKDKNGHVVIGQFPNVPIVGWFVCMVSAHIAQTGPLRTGLSDISTAFLFTWAYLEIAQGASYFRRLLGIIVGAYLLVMYFR